MISNQDFWYCQKCTWKGLLRTLCFWLLIGIGNFLLKMHKVYLRPIQHTHIYYLCFFVISWKAIKKLFCTLLYLSNDEKYLYLKSHFSDLRQSQFDSIQVLNRIFSILVIFIRSLFCTVRLSRTTPYQWA